MATGLALLSAFIFAAGIYLVLADRTLRALIGLGLVAQAGVIAVLAAGRVGGNLAQPGQAEGGLVLAQPFAIVVAALGFAALLTVLALISRTAKPGNEGTEAEAIGSDGTARAEKDAA